MIELLTIRGDGDAKRKPPTGVLLAHGHFEPSALLSVLASTRTWVGFGGFGPFWEFIWAKGTEGSDYSKARRRLEARV